MLIFVYTFVIIFIALIVILGLGSFLKGNAAPEVIPEGAATAAMCTTRLLGRNHDDYGVLDDDFVIEQDMVYTYDSFDL
ncbi:MAG: hypothetical protein E7307_07030 [Butyrivibrio sp.]|nr:hypothetical protein [Butyrivibrio sp.]